MVADILDVIYRTHSHRQNCQVPYHPSFCREGLWLSQTPTSLIMLLINRLAACRSSAWLLFNSLARSCEGKPLGSSQQHSPATVLSMPHRYTPQQSSARGYPLSAAQCRQLRTMTFWHQEHEKKGGRWPSPGQHRAVQQYSMGQQNCCRAQRGLPTEMQRETNYFCKSVSLLTKQCFLMKYHRILHLLSSRSISIVLKQHSIYLHVLSAVKIIGGAGRKALGFTLDFSSSVSKMEF